MTEWLSYSLSDLMMFSEDTYFRLFELQNRAVWPGQLAVLAAAAAVIGLAARGGPMAGRIASAIVAGFWLGCAWSFHLDHYAAINLAAPVFAAGFALQALLVLWVGLVRGRLAVAECPGFAQALGWVILIAAVAAYPLLAPLSGRPWLQAEIVGLAPDPTAAASFAIVLLGGRRAPCALLVVPGIWTLVIGATLWTVGAWHEAIVMPAITALTLAAALWRAVRSGESA